ncbi:hypothetical protein MLD38_034253 [Melastoma candidum]|uniref:Uncharacterized protein n=1 Tax=Melastoma candidum TaxID=119954 RepID=A0ACB9M9Z1_9MYRT|nr:hypothetical protein MLD38_034253 [Melastoma candidum]
MDMADETVNLVLVGSAVLTSICYCYFISSTLPKGTLRLLSLLPVLLLFAALPLVLSTVLLTGITTFFITWLATSKLLLFAFDQGPLSPSAYPPYKPFLLFTILACFPIKINPPNPKIPKSSPRKRSSPLGLPTKAVLLTATVLIYDRRDLLLRLHPDLLYGLYSVMLLLFVDVMVGFFVSSIGIVLGFDLQPPSNEPYLSTSLQDFWGKRWNLIVTDTLRHTVYNPLRLSLGPIIGPTWAQLTGLLGAFMVSGLVHELTFYYINRASPTWEVTGFFVLHGLCVAAEAAVKTALPDRFRLRPAVSVVLTLGFVVGTGTRLFFPPLIRNGADQKAIGEYKYLVGSLNALMGNLASLTWWWKFPR